MGFKEDLEKDLIKWHEAYGRAYCDKAAEQLTKAARIAILYFYHSYKPLYYDRYDNLKNLGYKKYKHNSGNGKIWGGVYMGYKYMQDYGHKGKITGIEHLKLVSSMTLFNGYHGTITKDYDDPYYYVGAHYSSPTPYDFVINYKNSEKFKKIVIDYATSVAKKQKYSVFNKIF